MSEPTLTIAKLTIGLFEQGKHVRDVVSGIDFSVPEGSITALVGESGSGKTLVGRATLGLLASALRVTGGDIQLGGRSLLNLPAPALRAVRGGEIGMVFQEPMVSLNPSLRIGDQMAEALIRHRGMSRKGARILCAEMLEKVGLSDPQSSLDAYPAQFSGGMRQRIMLASVLATRPKLLIADEPTTALDAIMRHQVMELMVELTREAGTSVLLMSHDLGMVSQFSDQVVVMRQGRQVEQGPVSRVLLTPKTDYTRNLLGAMPVRKNRPPISAAEPLVEAIEVSLTYHRPRRLLVKPQLVRPAVDSASFTIKRGETLAMVGESGSGKTTIGRALIRLLDVSGGKIQFEGADVGALTGASLSRFRKRTQIIFQDPNSSLNPRLRLEEIVAEPLRGLPGLNDAERRQAAQTMLAEVGLGADYERRFPHELSGGQRQRVGIARAIVGRPDFIVADEAVSALDVTVQAQVLDLLTRLQVKYGFAMMFVSHDLGVVEQIADRVAVMYRGHLVEIGHRDAIFDFPHHPYTRRLLAATPRMTETSDGGYVLVNAKLEPVTDRCWYDPDASPPKQRRLVSINSDHLVALAG